MFRVAVIEDDPEIANLIERRINKTEIVICSGTYEGPISYIEAGAKDDIVLLDISMPEMNGIDAIPKLLANNPELIIIMNTIRSESDIIFKAIKSGATGYIDKQSTTVNYKEVFTSVLNGGAYLTPSVALKVVDFFRSNKTDNRLTPRENDVAILIKEGKSYNEIGSVLDVSINTVRMHIKNIYTKLQINTRYELINLDKN